MKIVIITDVHGNLPALQAVLEVVKVEGYDLLFHLGDAIGIGPFPFECLHHLFLIPNSHLLMGNHDAWFAHGLPTPQPAWMSDGEVAHQLWTHHQIPVSFRHQIQQWPFLIQNSFQGVSISFLHYALKSSGSDFMSIERTPNANALDALFSQYQTDIVFYGHHHPFADINGRSRYINPGSLGCFTQPIARFTVVDCVQGEFETRHRQISYDDAPLYEAFEARKVPEREFLYKAFFGGRFPIQDSSHN